MSLGRAIASRPLRAARSVSVVRAIAAACALVLVVASAAPVRAQDSSDEQAPDTGLVVLTGALAGLTAGLATYVWSMPWRGFWSNRAELDDPVSLLLVSVGALGLGVAAAVLAEGSEDRMHILALSAASGLAVEVAVLLYGGLYHWMAPPGACEAVCTKVLFGSAPLLAVLVGFTGGLVHLATQ